MKEQVFASIGRLGWRPAAWIIYLETAIQLGISAMVFLFDSGFPIWIVVTGWIVLVCVALVVALEQNRKNKRESAVTAFSGIPRTPPGNNEAFQDNAVARIEFPGDADILGPRITPALQR